jgi:arylsulfatase A-like enzyme
MAAVLVMNTVTAASTRPSVIFILLDTTRADRFGAWGNLRPTTPTLDRLAADGVRFVRHHANSHATRPSMPQLMTGRYFHHNVLARFEEDANPREMSFARPDPTAMLLPALFRQAGYRTLGVSAHTWVTPDSDFGRTFDALEMLSFTNEEGHGDARPLVDRAIALWRARAPHEATFLYLHFMDMHMPRRLPEAEPRYPVSGYAWRSRFRPSGEPDFGRDRRRWSREDASDFTPDDRAHFVAVYDTRLQYTDEHLARLLAVVRERDPELRETMIVVTSDHGEELGEDGRTDHSDSLADGVQHVPWLMAGAGIAKGQQCGGTTEHVDVVPTLVKALGLAPPDGVRFDGTSWVDARGQVASPCGGEHAAYVWETYRGIRAHAYLLREQAPGTGEAVCAPVGLHHIDGDRRARVDARAVTRKTRALRRAMVSRLDGPQQRFDASRWDAPSRAFLLRTDYWRSTTPVPCVPMTVDLPRRALRRPGWFSSGRGLLVMDAAATAPLDVLVDVPPGSYQVDVATRPIASPPWLFGFARWARKALQPSVPTGWLPLGPLVVDARPARLEIPAASVLGHHVLGLRFTPANAKASEPERLDPGQQERLRALGYVE